jgi:hypothetical protein
MHSVRWGKRARPHFPVAALKQVPYSRLVCNETKWRGTGLVRIAEMRGIPNRYMLRVCGNHLSNEITAVQNPMNSMTDTSLWSGFRTG